MAKTAKKGSDTARDASHEDVFRNFEKMKNPSLPDQRL